MEEILAFCTQTTGAPAAYALDAYHASYNAHNAAGMRLSILENAKVRVHSNGESYDLEPGYLIGALEQEIFVNNEANVQVLGRWEAGEHVFDRIFYHVDAENQQNFVVAARVQNGCITEMDFYTIG